MTISDLLHGEVTGVVDDIVLRRNDGVAAYNLAVVVDDAYSRIDQVVRGDDLLASAINQAYLAALLGAIHRRTRMCRWLLNADGRRLAKRDGAVTLPELAEAGTEPGAVLSWIAESLNLAAPGEQASLDAMLERFDPGRLPLGPWVVIPEKLTRAERLG